MTGAYASPPATTCAIVADSLNAGMRMMVWINVGGSDRGI
jgi:hypothetical protein